MKRLVVIITDEENILPLGAIEVVLSFHMPDGSIYDLPEQHGTIAMENEQQIRNREFGEYIRGQKVVGGGYPKELQKTFEGDGGFLIPTNYRSPRPGWWGAFLRWIGNKHGWITVNLQEALMKRFGGSRQADPASPETS